MTLRKPDLSTVMLIGANLVPLAGVFFLHWDVASILVLYWFENLVIGFFNILKMSLLSASEPLVHISKFFFVPFFCIHFGGFCFGHAIFLIAILKHGDIDAIMKSTNPFISLTGTLLAGPSAVSLLCILGLFASHGTSFIQNYLRGNERRTLSLAQLMGQPYSRIVILHIAIIVGGMPTMILGSPLPLLVALVLLKIILDLRFYVKSHKASLDPQASTASELTPLA